MKNVFLFLFSLFLFLFSSCATEESAKTGGDSYDSLPKTEVTKTPQITGELLVNVKGFLQAEPAIKAEASKLLNFPDRAGGFVGKIVQLDGSNVLVVIIFDPAGQGITEDIKKMREKGIIAHAEAGGLFRLGKMEATQRVCIFFNDLPIQNLDMLTNAMMQEFFQLWLLQGDPSISPEMSEYLSEIVSQNTTGGDLYVASRIVNMLTSDNWPTGYSLLRQEYLKAIDNCKIVVPKKATYFEVSPGQCDCIRKNFLK